MAEGIERSRVLERFRGVFVFSRRVTHGALEKGSASVGI